MSGIKSRIESLLRKAEDPSVSEAEAHLFEEKAIELMVREGLTKTDLNLSQEEQRQEIIRWEKKCFLGNEKAAIDVLYHNVSKIFGVSGLKLDLYEPVPKAKRMHPQGGYTFICYGTQAQKEITELWLDHLMIQLNRDIACDRPKSKKSYAVTWVDVVLARLRDFVQYIDETEEFQTGTALALRTAQDVRDQEWPSLSPGAKVIADDMISAEQGAIRGEQAAMLGKEVGPQTVQQIGAGS